MNPNLPILLAVFTLFLAVIPIWGLAQAKDTDTTTLDFAALALGKRLRLGVPSRRLGLSERLPPLSVISHVRDCRRFFPFGSRHPTGYRLHPASRAGMFFRHWVFSYSSRSMSLQSQPAFTTAMPSGSRFL